MRLAFVFAAASLVATIAAPPVRAQPQQPASVLQQQNEQRARQLLQRGLGTQQGPTVVSPPQATSKLPPPGGATVLLRSVHFAPKSAFLTDAELNAIADRYIGKRVDFHQIAALVKQVNDLYAKKGLVTAAATLPQQDITGGNLKVKLVEGKLGKLTVVGRHVTRPKYLFDRVHFTTENDVVDVPMAARDITYFNKTNHAQLRLLLKPGASFGLTDLSLGVTEPPRNQLSLFVDNEGMHSTGDLEYGGSFRHYGLLGMDDTLLLYLTKSEGSIAGTASYDIPVTRSGTRLGVSYTQSNISVINGPTSSLNETGVSRAGTVTISQPLWATDAGTLLAIASASRVYSASDSSGVPLVDSVTDKGIGGFFWSHTGKHGYLSLQPQLVYASVKDKVLNDTENILLATGFGNATFDLAKGVSLQARGAWQYTQSHLLPGNLLFNVGGPSTVRGYPSDGVAGDSGYYGQFELHQSMARLVKGLDGFAFTDVGEVFSTFPKSTLLVSAGVGLAYHWKNRATLEITVAAPLIHSVSDQTLGTLYGRLTVKPF